MVDQGFSLGDANLIFAKILKILAKILEQPREIEKNLLLRVPCAPC